MARERRRDKGQGTVFQMANGRWRAQIDAGFTDAGNRRRITAQGRTRTIAMDRLRDKIRAFEKGGIDSVKDVDMTFKKWGEMWLEEKAEKIRPSTYSQYERDLRKYAGTVIGHLKLSEITPLHIRKITKPLRDAGKHSTARLAQGTVLRCLKDAKREGHNVNDSIFYVPTPAGGKNTRTAIPVEDAKKLLVTASNLPDKARYYLALFYGLRQGEALGLTWSRVDFDAKTITIDRQLQELVYENRALDTFRLPVGLQAERLEGRFWLTQPKTKAGMRIAPLLPFMERALLEWMDECPESPHGLVFPDSTGRPRTKRDDTNAWRTLQDMADVHKGEKYYVLHEARNTAATLLLEARVDPFIITQILGHTTITTSQGYMRAGLESKRKALECVTKLLGM